MRPPAARLLAVLTAWALAAAAPLATAAAIEVAPTLLLPTVRKVKLRVTTTGSPKPFVTRVSLVAVCEVCKSGGKMLSSEECLKVACPSALPATKNVDANPAVTLNAEVDVPQPACVSSTSVFMLCAYDDAARLDLNLPRLKRFPHAEPLALTGLVRDDMRIAPDIKAQLSVGFYTSPSAACLARPPAPSAALCEMEFGESNCTAAAARLPTAAGTYPLCVYDTSEFFGPMSTTASTVTLAAYVVKPARAFMFADPRPFVEGGACTHLPVAVFKTADCPANSLTPPEVTYTSCGAGGLLEQAAGEARWVPLGNGDKPYSFCTKPSTPHRGSPDKWVPVGAMTLIPKPRIVFAPAKIAALVPNRLSTTNLEMPLRVAPKPDCTGQEPALDFAAAPGGTVVQSFLPLKLAPPAAVYPCLLVDARWQQAGPPIETQAAPLRYAPLFAKEPAVISVSDLVPAGTRLKFLPPGGTCGAPDGTWTAVPAHSGGWAALPSMTFDPAGEHVLCSSSLTGVPLRTLRVHNRAAVAAKSLVVGMNNTLRITNLFAGAPVFVATTCDAAPIASKTVGAGDVLTPWAGVFKVPASVTVGAPAHVCVKYPAGTDREVAVSVGAVTFMELRHDRYYFVKGVKARIGFSAALANFVVFLEKGTASSGCPAKPADAAAMSLDASGRAVVDGAKYDLGQYTVCVQPPPATGYSGVSSPGLVQFVAQNATSWTPSWAPVAGLPATANVAQNSGKVHVAAITDVGGPTPCDEVTGGVAQGTEVLVPASGSKLCVEAPPSAHAGAQTFWLEAADVTNKGYTNVVKSFFVGATADVKPVLPGIESRKPLYWLAADCAAEPRYSVAPFRKIDRDLPPGTYRLCTQIPPHTTAFAQSTDSVTVFPRVTHTLWPDQVRRNFPYKVTVAANSGLPSPPRVYLLKHKGPCHLAADKLSFGGSVAVVAADGSGLVSMPPLADRTMNYTLCTISQDETASAEVLGFQPRPFLKPSQIPYGDTVKIMAAAPLQPPALRKGRIAFAGLNCVAAISPALDNLAVGLDGRFTLSAPTLAALQAAATAGSDARKGEYCEEEGSSWVFKGDINFVPSFTATGVQPFKPGVVNQVTVSPEAAAWDPMFSPTPACEDLPAATSGALFPRFNEGGDYWVCVRSPADPFIWYTADPGAKVQFTTFALSGTDLWHGVQNRLKLAPPLADVVDPAKTTGAYLSSAEDCNVTVKPEGPWAIDSAGAVPSEKLIGTAFLCLPTPVATMVPVKQVTVWRTPTVAVSGPAIFGSRICFAVDDSSSPVAVMKKAYVAGRWDQCGNSSMVGGAVENKARPCVPTHGAPYGVNLTMCLAVQTTESPARELLVPALTFMPTLIAMQPPILTVGVPSYDIQVTPLTAPGIPSNETLQPGGYRLAKTKADCQVGGKFVEFKTDATGKSLARVAQPPVPLGELTLCMKNTWAPYSYLDDINEWEAVIPTIMSRQYHYGLASTLLPATTPVLVAPTLELEAEHFRGFSSTALCGDVANEAHPSFVVNGTNLLIESSSTHAKLHACAYVPWNRTVVAFAEVTFVQSLVATRDHFACADHPVTFTASALAEAAFNGTPSVFLARDGCCMAANYTDAGSIVTGTGRFVEAAGTTPASVVVNLPSDQFFAHAEENADIVDMHICVANPGTSSCLDSGAVIFNKGTCREAGERALFGAPTQGADRTLLIALLCAGAFLLILFALILICCLCLRLRRRRGIPHDQQEPEGGWNTSVDRRDLLHSRKGRSEVLQDRMNVPVDMGLNTCHDNPQMLAELLEAEEVERGQIWQAAAFTTERLWTDFDNETRELLLDVEEEQRLAAEERGRGLGLRERLQLEDVEAEARDVLGALQDEERLRLAELEHASWHSNSETTRRELELAIEREERAKSRKRRLLESSSAMMAHIDTAAQLRNVTPRRDEGITDEYNAPAEDTAGVDPFESIQRRQSLFAAMTGDTAGSLTPQVPQQHYYQEAEDGKEAGPAADRMEYVPGGAAHHAPAADGQHYDDHQQPQYVRNPLSGSDALPPEVADPDAVPHEEAPVSAPHPDPSDGLGDGQPDHPEVDEYGRGYYRHGEY